jgi:hypothetical protein
MANPQDGQQIEPRNGGRGGFRSKLRSVRSPGQLTRDDLPAWRLDMQIIMPHHKNLVSCKMAKRASEFYEFYGMN